MRPEEGEWYGSPGSDQQKRSQTTGKSKREVGKHGVRKQHLPTRSHPGAGEHEGREPEPGPRLRRGLDDNPRPSQSRVLLPKISDMTSERVASRSLKTPLIALVTNELPGLCTPRI